MALADVQMIVQSLENAKQQQLQKAQLAQQHDQFIQDLQQRHEQMVNEQEVARANSKMNIAKLASTDPNFLASYAGATKTGTTGDPGYQSPNIGGQPLALNPSRDPNEYNTYNIPGIGDLNSPTMPTYIAQQAAQKLALAKAELGPKEEFSQFEFGQKKETAADLAKSQMDIEKSRESSEQNIATLKSINELLGKQLDRQTDKEKQLEDVRWHNLQNQMELGRTAAEQHRWDLQYGVGSYTDAVANAKQNVMTGRATLGDAVKDLPPAAQKAVAVGIANDHGISTNKEQQSVLSQLGNLSQILSKMDAFNDTSLADPKSWGDRTRLIGEIHSQLGSIAQVLNAEPGRKAQWMFDAAEKGAVPQNTPGLGTIIPGELAKQNFKKREDFAKQVKDYANGVFANIPDEQRKQIFDLYGIDKMFSPRNSTSDAAKDFKKKHGLQ